MQNYNFLLQVLKNRGGGNPSYKNQRTMKTIRLQILGKNLYPIDSVSAKTLRDQFSLDRIPGNRFIEWSPKIVKAGYKMAIVGNINDIEL